MLKNKSGKVLTALVNAQLSINRQCGIHLIKVPVTPNEQFTYHTPHPKGNPSPLPPITQDYDNNDTLEPKLSYPDDKLEAEAAESMPRRSSRLIQHTNFVSPPAAGISQAALAAFMGNLYMQELQQNIVKSVDPIEMEEVANGVVHPVTKETITKYKKLISDPLLQDD